MEFSGRNDSETCPICLEPLLREAYLDRCFHAFCYQCIAQWSKFVKDKQSQSQSSSKCKFSIKCPLCKTENFSIVYNFDGVSFHRHYVNDNHHDSFFSSNHGLRAQCYRSEAGNLFNIQQYWKYHRYRQKNNWLQNWLRREIQTLTLEEDVDIIVHHIQGVLEAIFTRKGDSKQVTPEPRREEFRALLSDAAMPFLHGRTARFVDELELFLASGLNIEAYDRVYMHHLGISPPTEEARDPDPASD
ncbi:hypothetical protein AXF42_Ash012390 [Apostasia shenzhenica]|uniref:RING-type domain-containing protein n=1 Tax=Apostasia shenzhenica TaxID=1088818 RepID=A0A2I0AD19_9ASPA|nr:hypothetical protein AXF42_Ash012390 [Apostasia shenzhenica]